MDAIVISGLTKRYGTVTAVDDLSFSVPTGHVTALLGPNGAGKTTTLQVLLGFVTPDEGSAVFLGGRYAELERPAHHVGAVLDTGSFHPGRKARDHLDVMATAAGIDRKRVREVLDTVGLAQAADRRVGGFSLGMRQRLALAGALLGEPDVLVLDEPANGLDPEGVRWLRTFLREYAAAGHTVLVSSHMLAEVAQTVDYVVIISKGRLVRQGTLAEIAATDPAEAHPLRVRTSDPARAVEALRSAGITVDVDAAGVLTTHGAGAELVGSTVAATGLAVYEMTRIDSNLEDAFFELTGTMERSSS